jgi:hypothetical protein
LLDASIQVGAIHAWLATTTSNGNIHPRHSRQFGPWSNCCCSSRDLLLETNLLSLAVVQQRMCFAAQECRHVIASTVAAQQCRQLTRQLLLRRRRRGEQGQMRQRAATTRAKDAIGIW